MPFRKRRYCQGLRPETGGRSPTIVSAARKAEGLPHNRRRTRRGRDSLQPKPRGPYHGTVHQYLNQI